MLDFRAMSLDRSYPQNFIAAENDVGIEMTSKWGTAQHVGETQTLRGCLGNWG